ncbi:hypothetical protein K443DRAFT_11305 [Laccaria amethystina LaAM-08-1]|uniref:Uncharacterized protein n=1 Tax=Laccaria amethystina LaAM-08-1 TaxID=1095629 RepID=A0A0C9WJZ1_9AGAR|nr:hypothetical protein K443DRAFT_11305 [Laccaria amethystina LaAM-08-1]
MNQDTLDIMADIGLDDLPEGITALGNSFQDFCNDAERQKVKDLTTVHETNISAIRS